MTARVRSLACLFAISSALAAGCGDDGGSGSDEEKIRSTVERFAQAFADGDGDEVCERLTSAAKKQLLEGSALFGGRDCADMIELVRGYIGKDDLQKLEDIEIQSVKITGDRAEVTTNAEIDPEDDGPMRLVKVDGEWLVDADPADEEDGSAGTETLPEPEPESGAEEDAAAIRAVAQDEPLVLGDYSVRVLSVERADELPGDEYTDPVKADGEFLILRLKVRNTAKKVARFDTRLTKLIDVDGTEYSAETGGGAEQIMALPDYLDEREIQPKTAETGAVAFDLPEAANVREIRFADSLDSFDEKFSGAITLDTAG